MKQPKSKWMPLFCAGVAVAIFATQPVRAEVLEKTKKVSGVTVRYKVVLPNGYDPAKAYPAILAFGGGPQTMPTVDSVLNRNFRAEAEKRGYIVVAPAAPDVELFFEEGARIFPEFLKLILADYKIKDNKFHIAGPSNGGIAAFHVAAANPQYFLSVTAFPGYMWEPSVAKLQAISKMCVFMYVGENDEYMWHAEMKKEAEFLRSKGTVAQYTVEKGQPHRMETLAGDNAGRLFDDLRKPKKVVASRTEIPRSRSIYLPGPPRAGAGGRVPPSARIFMFSSACVKRVRLCAMSFSRAASSGSIELSRTKV